MEWDFPEHDYFPRSNLEMNPELIWSERFLIPALRRSRVNRLGDEESYMLEEAVTQFLEAMDASLWSAGPQHLKEAMASAIMAHFEGLFSKSCRPPTRSRTLDGYIF